MGSRTWWGFFWWSSLVWGLDAVVLETQEESCNCSQPHQSFWSQPLPQKRGLPSGSLLATFVPSKKRVFSHFLSDPTVLPTSCQEGFKWDTIPWSPPPYTSQSSSAPRISTWHGSKTKEEGFPSSLIFKYQVSGVWFKGWSEELRDWRGSVSTFLPC